MSGSDERPPELPPDKRLVELTVAEVRRIAITLGLLALVFGMFLSMVHELLVAAVLAAIAAAYLRPLQRWLTRIVRYESLAAILLIGGLLLPAVALVVYGYLELRDAAEYLAANTGEVARRINQAMERLPLVGPVEAEAAIESGLRRAAALATQLPEGLRSAMAEFGVNAAVFLFSAFYVLLDGDTIAEYLRAKVPAQYTPLARRLEQAIHSALYGAIYGTLVTQTLKAIVVLALNLGFGIPLPVVLSLIAFVIGFFPLLGTWIIYVPAALYLLVFENALWQAVAMLSIGIVASTVLLSFILRPMLAADRASNLSYYWMFVALVAGVYTFGVPGVVLGPIVVGLLRATVDTVTGDLPAGHEDQAEARVFTREL